MTTPNLGLPTITGNMTADVVRDLNALAEAIDDSVVSLGKDNTSVNSVKAITLEVDTRKKKYTTDANGQLQKIEYLDGTTVVKTVIFTYDASGQLTRKTETAAGKTVTTTFVVKADGTLDEITKEVV